MKNSEWVQDKEDRVTVLEQTLVAANLGTFVGTMEDYKKWNDYSDKYRKVNGKG